MTKNLSITTIIKHFQSRSGYLQNPPERWDFEQMLNYIERDDYNQLLFDYGEINCLIVLDMFETLEHYDTCAEILRQIETHNRVTDSKFKTSLREINLNQISNERKSST